MKETTEVSKSKQEYSLPHYWVPVPLIWNLLMILAKSILIPSIIINFSSSNNRFIYSKENLLIGPNYIDNLKQEIENFMEIGKYIEESALLKKSVIETIKNEAQKQRDEFLDI